MKSRKKTPLSYGRASGSCGAGLTPICMMATGQQRVPRKEAEERGLVPMDTGDEI